MEILALLQGMETLALLQLTGDITVVGVGIAAGASMIGSGIGMGYLFGQVIASIHRQPEAFEQSRPWMFFGLAFVEQFAIFGILFALLISFDVL